ncbi:MAG: ATP--guanido phosphotransferase [bacterium]|nr:ATP--guanido phosphotransferase [bacterium]
MEKEYKVTKLEEILKETKWIYSKLNEDIVITSRVRIARNIKGYPFPYNISYEKGKELEKILLEVLCELPYKKIFVVNLSSLNEKQKKFLIETHLISKEFSESSFCDKVVIIPEKKVSIMINEEDHLRIQVILPGLNLKKCWEIVNEVDDFIDSKIEYAFSPEFGYLTSCPTNTGTGLRSSVLVHIPGIKFLKKEKFIFENIESIGITVRGFYGEGSLPLGSIYQISSTETTGKTELEIIEELESVIKLIIEEERKCIEKIKRDKKLKEKILNRIFYIMNEKNNKDGEFFDLYSLIFLSHLTGIIKIKKKDLKSLFFSMFLEPQENKNYIFYKKEGKILRKKFWEKLNV